MAYNSNIFISKINPTQYKKVAPNFHIIYGCAATKFGNCLLAINEGRVCFLSFYDGEQETASLDDLIKTFPKATLQQNNDMARNYATYLFSDYFSNLTCNVLNANSIAGNQLPCQPCVNILMKGTEFETSVWEQLLNLRKGSTASYFDIAVAIGKPKAIRAVAKAVAKNNLSYVIPCHRVISKSQGLSKYRWGAERKFKMLKYEEAI